MRVHPTFWLAHAPIGCFFALLITEVYFFVWIGGAFVSVLIHEMGHALMTQKYGEESAVRLYWWGGMAELPQFFHTGRQRKLVYFAGPGAQLVFGFAILIVTCLILGGIEAKAGGFEWVPFRKPDGEVAFHGIYKLSPFEHLLITTGILLFMNILMALVNLLPLPGFDGEIVLRELFGGRGATPKRPPWERDPNWWKYSRGEGE